MDAREKSERVLSLQAFHRHGHEGSGGLGDGAPVALEGNIGDGTVGELDVEGELVTTQRVDSIDRSRRTIERMEVPRPARMIDDHLLVKVGDVTSHCSTPCSACGVHPVQPRSLLDLTIILPEPAGDKRLQLHPDGFQLDSIHHLLHEGVYE